jgi:hypothetical protein
MSNIPEAYISHTSSGRIRVKIPAKKNDLDYFSRLREHISPIPGVERVEVNPVTASILVEHTLDLKSVEDLKPVADYSEMSGFFKLSLRPELAIATNSTADQRSATSAERWAAALAALNAQVKGWSAGMLDFSTLAILGLISVGLIQASRGIVAVPAITALWYASSILMDQFSKESTKTLISSKPETVPQGFQETNGRRGNDQLTN